MSKAQTDPVAVPRAAGQAVGESLHADGESPRTRILIVTGIFPPDAGGPASYVPKVATELCRRGHAVEVLTLSDRLDHDDSVLPFRVHRIRRRLFWPWRILLTVLTVWRLSRDKDVVYVNGLSSEATLGAWLSGRPTVHKIVGDHAWERATSKGWFSGTIDEFQSARKSLRLRLLDMIRSLPLRVARTVIVPSEYLRRIVLGWGIPSRKVRVIYNAAPTHDQGSGVSGQGSEKKQSALSSLTPDPRPLTPTEGGEDLTLVTVCRLVPWKGVDALIRLVSTMPGARLLIVGDGPLKPELETLARTCKVSDRVNFLGRVAQREVPTFLTQADVFILNSTYEGLPHIVLEAMAAGIPVIATNAGGTGEVVEHEVTGLLVPPGDEPALKAAVERLHSDRALAQRLSAAAKARLKSRFAFDTMVRETATALEGCSKRAETVKEATPSQANLSVLSLGYTRGLWEGETAEDYQRMMGYGSRLKRYVIVANSYKRHRLRPRQLAANVVAIPTDAFSPLDSLLCMLWIGAHVLRQRGVKPAAADRCLIQAQDPCYCGLAAVLLGKCFRVPVVVCVYGPNVHDEHWLNSHWSHRLLGPIGRWVLRRARCIQVDGRSTACSLIASGYSPDRVEVKPLVPANLESFIRIPRKETEGSVSVPRLLFVGRLAAQKNLTLLLQAARSLRDSGSRFELLLVGEGPEEQSLRQLVAHNGLGDCVRFRGTVSREEIVRVFAEADVFVLNSHYEGYPRVLMEAAAAALPIVTTAVSGSDEAVLNGESGFIVPIGQMEPLVEKLALLIRDAGLRIRLGEAGRRHIAEQLDPATNTPRQLAIWDRATR